MGTMTRLEMQTEILENIDNRNDVTAEQAARWINHTYRHLTDPSVREFEDLAATVDITLVPDQASYSLTEATIGFRVLKIRAVSYLDAAVASITPNTRRRRLKPMTIQEYDGTQHPSITEPSQYVINEDQTLLIHSTPANTNTVRLRMFREVAALDSDSSTTVLSNYWDDVLVTGAQARFEFKLGLRDRANETFQYYNSLIGNAQEKSILEGESWGIETSLSATTHMGTS